MNVALTLSMDPLTATDGQLRMEKDVCMRGEYSNSISHHAPWFCKDFFLNIFLLQQYTLMNCI